MLTGAWVTIGILRRILRCDLPIELWHIGPEEMGTDVHGVGRPSPAVGTGSAFRKHRVISQA